MADPRNFALGWAAIRHVYREENPMVNLRGPFIREGLTIGRLSGGGVHSVRHFFFISIFFPFVLFFLKFFLFPLLSLGGEWSSFQL